MKHITHIIHILCLLPALALLCTGCHDNPSDPPYIEPLPAVTHTIQELKAMYKGRPFIINENIVIAGKMISDDRDGNIYRSMYIEDRTSGIEIRIGRSGLYNFYKLGQTVYVKCNGLALGDYGGSVQIGYKSPNGEMTTIDADYLIKKHIFAGDFGPPVSPNEIKISDIGGNTDTKLSTLIRIEDLTFDATTQPSDSTIYTWALPSSTGNSGNAVSQQYRDNEGRTIVIRTSNYAKFALTERPTRPIHVTGILTVFNSTYQITLRSLSDVEVVE
jgi:hypothetical protein